MIFEKFELPFWHFLKKMFYFSGFGGRNENWMDFEKANIGKRKSWMGAKMFRK